MNAKNKKIRFFFGIALAVLCLDSGVQWIFPNAGTPPTGRTGSPGDGSNCASCHSGTAQSNSSSLTLTGLPSGGWRPNTQYNLTLALSAGSKFGFEITSEKSDNSKVGSWSAGSNNQVISSNWVGHSNANTTTNQWSFTWTAPSGGSGAITYYAAGNAANNNGSTSGDTIHLQSWSIPEGPNISSLSPDFGTPNETLNIHGTAFETMGSTVNFHNTRASWSSWSATSVTATVPSLSGVASGVVAVNVNIENSTGTSSNATFNYINAAPTVTSINPSSGTKNTTVSISSVSGTNFSPSASVRLTKTGESAITATSVTITTSTKISAASFNLANATTGFWNVAVINPDSSSSTLNNAFEVTVPVPATPSNFSGGVLSTTSIQWSWQDNATDETAYRVYSSTGGKISSDLAANTTFFIWTNLTENTSYQAFARAFNANGESQNSNTVTKFTLTNSPRSSQIVGFTSTTIQISWLTSAATTYWIERSSIASNSGFIHVATATASPYTNTSLAPSTTYYYRLRAINGDFTPTIYDSVISTQTYPLAPTAPAFTGTVISSTAISWGWDSQNNVTNFIVRTSTGGTLTTLLGGTTSWLEISLTSATSYTRSVRAQNPSGFADSSEATRTTPQSSATAETSQATTVTASDQKTKVELAANALGGTGSVLISLDPANNPLAVNPSDITTANNKLTSNVAALSGALREFTAIVAGARKTDNFSATVTITLPYTDADDNGIVDGTTIRAENLALYSLDETSKEWVLVSGSTLNKTAKTLSAPVSHFSVYTLIGATAANSLSSLKIFPNPLRPQTGAQNIHFQNLTETATIRIYTISAELVTTINKIAADGNEKNWNAKNASGNSLASGVYFAIVESSSEKKILKFAIER